MAEIGPNTRVRLSPFYEATVMEGVTAFSPYNSMLMPTSFGDPAAEYDRLMNGVALWDVAVAGLLLAWLPGSASPSWHSSSPSAPAPASPASSATSCGG